MMTIIVIIMIHYTVVVILEQHHTNLRNVDRSLDTVPTGCKEPINQTNPQTERAATNEKGHQNQQYNRAQSAQKKKDRNYSSTGHLHTTQTCVRSTIPVC